MAPTVTRKQREIAQREDLILETARKMLLERGYLGLTMDRIAEEIEYSKGTVYQHFSSKEDLICALAAQTHERRGDLFESASTFLGRPRERIIAAGIAHSLLVALYPTHLQSEQIIHASSIAQKADTERIAALYSGNQRCFNVGVGIVRDAIAQGDLTLAEGMKPEELVFGLWSMTHGGHLLVSSAFDLEGMGIANPPKALRRNIHAVLDGYGWKPLSSEWDYEKTQQRILSEVFSEEARLAGRI